MEKRLGRGLGTLLGGAPLDSSPSVIEVERISPNPYQPRRTFDAAALEELRDSIRQHGVLQPIMVRSAGDRYQIVSGERRWRAAQLAGLSKVPVVVRPGVTDPEMLELALVENLQRQDLNPIERAKGFEALISRLGLTQEQVADRVGLKRATIANHLRLLELPARVQDGLASNLIQMGHAKALLGLHSPAAMLQMMEQVVRKDLSVREVESRVRQKTTATPPVPAIATSAKAPPWVATLERRLGDALGAPVRISVGPQLRGSVQIQFFDRSELEQLIERLAPTPKL